MFICEKDKSEKPKTSLLDLIKFQKKDHKPVLEQFQNMENDNFVNFYQKDSNIKTGKKYIIAFKSKDLILKCYPQLIMAFKKGLSLKKMIQEYNLNSIQIVDSQLNIQNYLNDNNKVEEALTSPKLKKKFVSSLKSVKEKNEEFEDRKNGKTLNSKNSFKTKSMKNTDRDDFSDMLKMNLGDSQKVSPRKDFTLEDLESNQMKNMDIEYTSSQKKNIFYTSFKNIRERYQYKEQRSNKIQMRSEKIIKEFQLPDITSNRNSLGYIAKQSGGKNNFLK